MSPDKTQFNQGGLIFFDDVVHAIAFSPCVKLFAVGGQDKAPTVFLGPRFSESDVELRHKRSLSCLVTILSLSCFWVRRHAGLCLRCASWHTTPKRFMVRIVREVSETLGKVTPPSRKECNHLVDARTGGWRRRFREHFVLRPTCQRSTCLSLLLSCVPFVAATYHPNTVLCLKTISAICFGG